MFAESGNGTVRKLAPHHRPRCTLAHSCASYDRDTVSRSRRTSISCTPVLHQGIRPPPPTLDWGATMHPRQRSFWLLPLRPSPTPPRRRRSAALARLAVAAQPVAGPRGSPCTDSQKGIFKAGVVHCSAVDTGLLRSWRSLPKLERALTSKCLLATLGSGAFAAPLPPKQPLRPRFRQPSSPVHVLYSPSGPPKRLPCKGGLSRSLPCAPCIPVFLLRHTDLAAVAVIGRGG